VAAQSRSDALTWILAAEHSRLEVLLHCATSDIPASRRPVELVRVTEGSTPSCTLV
jgi:hypothetical protein